MNDPWYQIWVKFNGDIVQKIQICESVLMKFGSLPVAPGGNLKINEDGTIEIRSYSDMAFRMTKDYLANQGFSIEREVENYE
jgi:hypothetical protein